MERKQGLFTGVLEEEYDQVDALRASDLKHLLKTPAHFRVHKDGKMPPPSAHLQKSFDIGDALHACILEPDRYKSDFVTIPEFSGKGSRVEKQQWVAANEDKTCLTAEDFLLVDKMYKAIQDHEEAWRLLAEDGYPEVTGLAQLPDSDIWLKIRIDRLNKNSILLNLKTDAMDIGPGSYEKRAYNLNYHISAGFYTYVMELITGVVHPYILIVVQKEEPLYPVVVYEFTEEAIMEGQIMAMRAIGRYKECLESGEWPLYPGGILPLGLPGWVRRKQSIIE